VLIALYFINPSHYCADVPFNQTEKVFGGVPKRYHLQESSVAVLSEGRVEAYAGPASGPWTTQEDKGQVGQELLKDDVYRGVREVRVLPACHITSHHIKSISATSQ
jgi:hypothetical protein